MQKAIEESGGGFIAHEGKKLGFGEVAADAAELESRDADLRQWGAGGLLGKPLPRLDLPAKSDGSLRFAGDVRLPHMVLAAVQMAPPGGELIGFSRAAAERQKGLQGLVVDRRWLAAIGETWWAAEQALKAARPQFTGPATPDTMTVLDEALESGSAEALFEQGDYDAAVGSARALGATYRIARVLPHIYEIVRILDNQVAGWFTSDLSVVAPHSIDLFTLRAIARQAVKEGKTSWVGKMGAANEVKPERAETSGVRSLESLNPASAEELAVFLRARNGK